MNGPWMKGQDGTEHWVFWRRLRLTRLREFARIRQDGRLFTLDELSALSRFKVALTLGVHCTLGSIRKFVLPVLLCSVPTGTYGGHENRCGSYAFHHRKYGSSPRD